FYLNAARLRADVEDVAAIADAVAGGADGEVAAREAAVDLERVFAIDPVAAFVDHRGCDDRPAEVAVEDLAGEVGALRGARVARRDADARAVVMLHGVVLSELAVFVLRRLRAALAGGHRAEHGLTEEAERVLRLARRLIEAERAVVRGLAAAQDTY